MQSSDTVARFRELLQREKPLLAQRYHVTYLGLFGSYLRGDQRADSDLDSLVSFSAIPSLFRFIELENHLSDLLSVKVDLVLKEALKPAIGRRVLDEVVPV